MSYDDFDEARDTMHAEIARELYPEHKSQAIIEFTGDRLQSYYVSHPMVMRPAVDALQEGRNLQAGNHSSAAVVFFTTAIELLLKATLLKPVVHGLVHSDGLAQVVVEQALGQSGFDRYTKLLARLFSELAGLDIDSIRRSATSEHLLGECTAVQKLRNTIIHQGAHANADQAEHARLVSVAVYDLIVHPMLTHIGLKVSEHGQVLKDQNGQSEFSAPKTRLAKTGRQRTMTIETQHIAVFSYGSNMLSARIKERVPSAHPIGPAMLSGYSLRWNKRSKDGSSKCSIEETGRNQDKVWGVLYEVSASEKPMLDTFEGLGHGYDERSVLVICHGNAIRALAYYATSVRSVTAAVHLVSRSGCGRSSRARSTCRLHSSARGG